MPASAPRTRRRRRAPLLSLVGALVGGALLLSAATPALASEALPRLAPQAAVAVTPMARAQATWTGGTAILNGSPTTTTAAGARVFAAVYLHGQPLDNANVVFFERVPGGTMHPIITLRTNIHGQVGLMWSVPAGTTTFGAWGWIPAQVLNGHAIPAHYSGASPLVAVTATDDLRSKVLAEAASLVGVPYLYGGSTPATGFDCSGYVRWVFAVAAHIALPHTAAGQYALSQPIPTAALEPGDLMFFTSGGAIYHVSIYAGHGQMYEAPYTGLRVRLTPIWGSNYIAGRLLP